MRQYRDADFAPLRTPRQAEINERLLAWRLVAGDAVVVAGGGRGIVSDLLLERYPEIEVYLFEPQRPFAKALAARYADEPNVHVRGYGLGERDASMPMTYTGSDAATFLSAPPGPECKVREWGAVMYELSIERVALVHLNVEGYEYVLMPHLIDSGAIARVDQIAVSAHPVAQPVPGAETWGAVEPALLATHRPLWVRDGWHAYERKDR